MLAPAEELRRTRTCSPVRRPHGIDRALCLGAQEVPAGCVLALAGLELCVLRSATLSSTPAAPALAPMLFQAAPIVRVAVEPADPSQVAPLSCP